MEESVLSPDSAMSRSAMLRSSVVPTVFGEGAVLLDLTTKYFYHLNNTAWAIAQLIESTGASRDAVLERCKHWGFVPFEREQICSFLQQLEDFGLIEEADPGAMPAVELPLRWSMPTIERQSEPLHRLVTSAFDPSIPLAE